MTTLHQRFTGLSERFNASANDQAAARLADLDPTAPKVSIATLAVSCMALAVKADPSPKAGARDEQDPRN